MYEKGDRVVTPHGPGEVVSKRMAPPTYSEVQAYTVRLDSKKDHPTYTGTAILASDVSKEE